MILANANQDDAGSFVKELQIQQAHQAVLEIHAALVMFEVEAVDRVLRMQAGETEAALNGTAVARFQFQVGEGFEGLRQAQVLGRGLNDHLIELAAHRRQAGLVQFQGECGHGDPFRIAG
jgi:hypothetical protein